MNEGNDCHAGLSQLKGLHALPSNERDLGVLEQSLDDYDNFVSVDDDDNIMDPLE